MHKSSACRTGSADLCICGPAGTGKSHFCEALGPLAIDTGRTVALVLHRRARRPRAAAPRRRQHLYQAIGASSESTIIVDDDISMLPVGEDAAEGFYRLVDACTRSAPSPSAAPAPRRRRRDHAQDPRHRHAPPATPPRARLRHRRSVLPIRASNHWQWVTRYRPESAG
jgi:hypothetical protein